MIHDKSSNAHARMVPYKLWIDVVSVYIYHMAGNFGGLNFWIKSKNTLEKNCPNTTSRGALAGHTPQFS